MRKKYLYSSIFLLGMTLFGSTYESASAATQSCDNDPSSVYACSTSSTGTWSLDTYKSNYNGDARLANYNNGSYSYRWTFNNFVATGTWNLSVYLYNPSFVDRNARYYMYSSNTLYEEYVGSIDQYAAASGWNNIGSAYVTGGNGFTVQLRSSQINTGADAITISN